MAECLHLRVVVSCVAALGFGTAAVANPKGGQVVGGSATIAGQGTPGVTVTQSSSRAIINWQSFNIGTGEVTQFIQPSAAAVALNRVTGDKSPSAIFGTLTANGRVFLVNPEGFLFAPSARINTAGFLATTHDIGNDDFLAGRFNFNIAGNPKASIVNQGLITVSDAGIGALVAPAVRNDGIITARLGRIALASANAFTLDLYGDDLIKFSVNDAITTQVIDVTTGKPVKSLIENRGTLSADGGLVALTATTARAVVDSVINNSGVIEARSAGVQNGKIVLGAPTAATKARRAPVQRVVASGVLDASGRESGETGGKVLITGEQLALAGTRIDASGANGGGTVLIGGDTGGGTPSSAVAGVEKAALDSQPVVTATDVSVDQVTRIEASALANGDGGKVVIWADGETAMSGTVLARGGALAGDGGFVEASGHRRLTYNGLVDVGAGVGGPGTLLLDPLNATISSIAGLGVITVAQVESALATGNVIVTTGAIGSEAGDLVVASPINWSTSSQLTLAAHRDVLINAGVSNSSTANVTLRADLDGNGTGTVIFGGSGFVSTLGGVNLFFNPSVNPAGSGVNATSYVNPTEDFSSKMLGGASLTAYMLVNTVFDLQNIKNNLSGTYAFGHDINAAALPGFAVIGSASAPFTGVLYGNGHVVNGLTITSSATSVGLFAAIGIGGEVADLHLKNASIIKTSPTGLAGGIAGANFGTITNSSVEGTLVGPGQALGLLVGFNGYPSGSPGYPVQPPGFGPGLIDEAFAIGSVSSSGLPGSADRVGGLVGYNLFGSQIWDSYARVAVSYTGSNPTSAAGGLVGGNHYIILTSYSTGTVSGAAARGGLVGAITLDSMVTDSYWDTQASGQATSTAGTPSMTIDLKSALPTGFSSGVWGLSGALNIGYPHLLWETQTITAGMLLMPPTTSFPPATSQLAAASLATDWSAVLRSIRESPIVGGILVTLMNLLPGDLIKAPYEASGAALTITEFLLDTSSANLRKLDDTILGICSADLVCSIRNVDEIASEVSNFPFLGAGNIKSALKVSGLSNEEYVAFVRQITIERAKQLGYILIQ